MQNAIHAKLEKRFDPDIWHVINVSNEHNQTEGAETYFKILVVCREFRGMPMEKVVLNYYIHVPIMKYANENQ